MTRDSPVRARTVLNAKARIGIGYKLDSKCIFYDCFNCRLAGKNIATLVYLWSAVYQELPDDPTGVIHPRAASLSTFRRSIIADGIFRSTLSAKLTSLTSPDYLKSTYAKRREKLIEITFSCITDYIIICIIIYDHTRQDSCVIFFTVRFIDISSL